MAGPPLLPLLLAALCLAAGANAAGRKMVGVYELSKGDFSVKVTNWGATVTSVVFPDSKGNLGDVVLGYDTIAEYVDSDYGIGSGSSANFTRRGNQGRGGGQAGHGGHGQGGQVGHPGGRGNGDGGRGRGQGGRGYGDGGRGRGQGGRGGFGRGNGAPRPVCQICNKVGHVALRCYSRFDHAYGGEEEHHSANHASTSYQVEPNWYMDSGATDHITGDLERLHMRDAYHGNDRVQVGNGAGSGVEENAAPRQM